MNVIPMAAVSVAAFILVSFIVVLVASIVCGGYIAACQLFEALRRARSSIVSPSLADTGRPMAPRHI